MREQRRAQRVPNPAQPEQRWLQRSLYPPTAAAVRLDVALDLDNLVLDIGIDVFDPDTRELLGRVVCVQHTITSLVDAAGQINAQLQRILLDVLDPDPF